MLSFREEDVKGLKTIMEHIINAENVQECEVNNRIESLQTNILVLEKWLKTKENVTEEKSISSLDMMRDQLKTISREMYALNEWLKLRNDVLELCNKFKTLSIHE